MSMTRIEPDVDPRRNIILLPPGTLGEYKGVSFQINCDFNEPEFVAAVWDDE